MGSFCCTTNEAWEGGPATRRPELLRAHETTPLLGRSIESSASPNPPLEEATFTERHTEDTRYRLDIKSCSSCSSSSNSSSDCVDGQGVEFTPLKLQLEEEDATHSRVRSKSLSTRVAALRIAIDSQHKHDCHSKKKPKRPATTRLSIFARKGDVMRDVSEPPPRRGPTLQRSKTHSTRKAPCRECHSRSTSPMTLSSASTVLRGRKSSDRTFEDEDIAFAASTSEGKGQFFSSSSASSLPQSSRSKRAVKSKTLTTRVIDTVNPFAPYQSEVMDLRSLEPELSKMEEVVSDFIEYIEKHKDGAPERFDGKKIPYYRYFRNGLIQSLMDAWQFGLRVIDEEREHLELLRVASKSKASDKMPFIGHRHTDSPGSSRRLIRAGSDSRSLSCTPSPGVSPRMRSKSMTPRSLVITKDLILAQELVASLMVCLRALSGRREVTKYISSGSGSGLFMDCLLDTVEDSGHNHAVHGSCFKDEDMVLEGTDPCPHVMAALDLIKTLAKTPKLLPVLHADNVTGVLLICMQKHCNVPLILMRAAQVLKRVVYHTWEHHTDVSYLALSRESVSGSAPFDNLWQALKAREWHDAAKGIKQMLDDGSKALAVAQTHAVLSGLLSPQLPATGSGKVESRARGLSEAHTIACSHCSSGSKKDKIKCKKDREQKAKSKKSAKKSPMDNITDLRSGSQTAPADMYLDGKRSSRLDPFFFSVMSTNSKIMCTPLPDAGFEMSASDDEDVFSQFKRRKSHTPFAADRSAQLDIVDDASRSPFGVSHEGSEHGVLSLSLRSARSGTLSPSSRLRRLRMMQKSHTVDLTMTGDYSDTDDFCVRKEDTTMGKYVRRALDYDLGVEVEMPILHKALDSDSDEFRSDEEYLFEEIVNSMDTPVSAKMDTTPVSVHVNWGPPLVHVMSDASSSSSQSMASEKVLETADEYLFDDAEMDEKMDSLRVDGGKLMKRGIHEEQHSTTFTIDPSVLLAMDLPPDSDWDTDESPLLRGADILLPSPMISPLASPRTALTLATDKSSTTVASCEFAGGGSPLKRKQKHHRRRNRGFRLVGGDGKGKEQKGEEKKDGTRTRLSRIHLMDAISRSVASSVASDPPIFTPAASDNDTSDEDEKEEVPVLGLDEDETEDMFMTMPSLHPDEDEEVGVETDDDNISLGTATSSRRASVVAVSGVEHSERHILAATRGTELSLGRKAFAEAEEEVAATLGLLSMDSSDEDSANDVEDERQSADLKATQIECLKRALSIPGQRSLSASGGLVLPQLLQFSLSQSLVHSLNSSRTPLGESMTLYISLFYDCLFYLVSMANRMSPENPDANTLYTVSSHFSRVTRTPTPIVAQSPLDVVAKGYAHELLFEVFCRYRLFTYYHLASTLPTATYSTTTGVDSSVLPEWHSVVEGLCCEFWAKVLAKQSASATALMRWNLEHVDIVTLAVSMLENHKFDAQTVASVLSVLREICGQGEDWIFKLLEPDLFDIVMAVCEPFWQPQSEMCAQRALFRFLRPLCASNPFDLIEHDAMRKVIAVLDECSLVCWDEDDDGGGVKSRSRRGTVLDAELAEKEQMDGSLRLNRERKREQLSLVLLPCSELWVERLTFAMQMLSSLANIGIGTGMCNRQVAEELVDLGAVEKASVCLVTVESTELAKLCLETLSALMCSPEGAKILWQSGGLNDVLPDLVEVVQHWADKCSSAATVSDMSVVRLALQFAAKLAMFEHTSVSVACEVWPTVRRLIEAQALDAFSALIVADLVYYLWTSTDSFCAILESDDSSDDSQSLSVLALLALVKRHVAASSLVSKVLSSLSFCSGNHTVSQTLQTNDGFVKHVLGLVKVRYPADADIVKASAKLLTCL